MIAAIISGIVSILGRVFSDIFKDFIARPDVELAEIAPTCMEEENTGYNPDVDSLVADWYRVPRKD